MIQQWLDELAKKRAANPRKQYQENPDSGIGLTR
jgi:hypothetical protein